uniref:Leukotriene C4 synthase n=1 Tax=Oryctolagus cuniculus TaxID=9986 RepID=A0A5F9CVQ6_RABIT
MHSLDTSNVGRSLDGQCGLRQHRGRAQKGASGRKRAACSQPGFRLPAWPGSMAQWHGHMCPSLPCSPWRGAGRVLRPAFPFLSADGLIGALRHHERRDSSPGHCHPPRSPAASLLLPAGDLRQKSLPRVAAAHHWSAGIRARLPSPVRRGVQGGLSRVVLGPSRPGQVSSGPPTARRVNCSEYFPLFLAALWVAGIYFHEGAAALCGLVYLFARFRYFHSYERSAELRLAPMYQSAGALWLLIALGALGLLSHFLPAPLRAALLGWLRTLLPWA